MERLYSPDRRALAAVVVTVRCPCPRSRTAWGPPS